MTCSVGGCNRPTKVPGSARGFCVLHYQRWRKTGDPGSASAERPAKYVGLCPVSGCSAKRKGKYCSAHASRLRLHGDVMANVPVRVMRTRHGVYLCSIEGCGRLEKARGFCVGHLSRVERCGDPQVDVPIQTQASAGSGHVNSQGYRVYNRKGKSVLEHREVMANYLGRPLRLDETVHHINGDRLDNRVGNLELWTGRHPRGQRVADKVQWAKELLALYEPEALASTKEAL